MSDSLAVQFPLVLFSTHNCASRSVQCQRAKRLAATKIEDHLCVIWGSFSSRKFVSQAEKSRCID
jgi:hypothetical protein